MSYCRGGAVAAEFETAAAAGGWQPFLLPGSDEAASPQVSAMLAEVRHMVDTAAFDTALRVRQHACLQLCLQLFAKPLAAATYPVARHRSNVHAASCRQMSRLH